MNKFIHIFPKNNIIYLSNVYPKNHWANKYPCPSDNNFIAQLSIRDIPICIKLNPTDSRGYRGIAMLINEDMKTTFNRKYNIFEKLALNISLAIFAELYESFDLIAQTQIAGNNSQVLTCGKIQFGTHEEPTILHGHVIARGNIEDKYIANVPLRGPPLGDIFNMRGTINKYGDLHKTSWFHGEINSVASALSERMPIIVDCMEDVKIIHLKE